MSIGIALVGLGGFAQRHIEYIRYAEESGLGSHVAQVAIPSDQQLFADELLKFKKRGIKIYDSLRELLARERNNVELICIPTGIPLHRMMTIAALEAGYNVLVEKPAAATVQDIDAMLAAETKAGKICAVGFHHLYTLQFQRAKQWVCEGVLGKIQEVSAYACWPRSPAYYGRNNWAGRLADRDTWILDSPHNNALAHAINIMAFLGSTHDDKVLEPVSVDAELYRANSIESADTVVMRVESDEDVSLFFAASHAVDSTIDPLFIIRGEKGCLEINFIGDTKIQWNNGTVEEYNDEFSSVNVVANMLKVISGEKDVGYCPLLYSRTHTLCVNGSFDSSPVNAIPAELCVKDKKDGTVAVSGMVDTIKKAYAQKSLFSEIGTEWARSGRKIDMKDYHYFPSCDSVFQ